jgi:hypothetical protein
VTQTLLTRKDEGVGVGVFDSIAWAFEVHLKAPDEPKFNSAVLSGDESCPNEIAFYTQAEPLVTDTPAFVWRDQELT